MALGEPEMERLVCCGACRGHLCTLAVLLGSRCTGRHRRQAKPGQGFGVGWDPRWGGCEGEATAVFLLDSALEKELWAQDVPRGWGC